jgi:hypothetical protein
MLTSTTTDPGRMIALSPIVTPASIVGNVYILANADIASNLCAVTPFQALRIDTYVDAPQSLTRLHFLANHGTYRATQYVQCCGRPSRLVVHGEVLNSLIEVVFMDTWMSNV